MVRGESNFHQAYYKSWERPTARTRVPTRRFVRARVLCANATSRYRSERVTAWPSPRNSILVKSKTQAPLGRVPECDSKALANVRAPRIFLDDPASHLLGPMAAEALPRRRASAIRSKGLP